MAISCGYELAGFVHTAGANGSKPLRFQIAQNDGHYVIGSQAGGLPHFGVAAA
jgi:hypothetical protein